MVLLLFFNNFSLRLLKSSKNGHKEHLSSYSMTLHGRPKPCLVVSPSYFIKKHHNGIHGVPLFPLPNGTVYISPDNFLNLTPRCVGLCLRILFLVILRCMNDV